jgi:hypothetical protein
VAQWSGTLASVPVTVQRLGDGLTVNVYVPAYTLPVLQLFCFNWVPSNEGISPSAVLCGDQSSSALDDLAASYNLGADWNLYNLIFSFNGALYVCVATDAASPLRCRFAVARDALSSYMDILEPPRRF